VTARWVVDQVAPQRELHVTWQPISLLLKNAPDPESPYYAGAMVGHRALRVMEAIRAEHGDAAVFDWYWQCATLIHHDGAAQNGGIDLPAALERVGRDPALAAAADDERWDTPIRTRMDEGLALVGDNVGTPIIAFTAADGVRRGIFGPVITRVPDAEQSLRVWDAMEAFTTMDGFWELKRTRTESPDPGPRPDV
jgi:hypothetical protein